MPGHTDKVFTLADLIDYELQIVLVSHMQPEDLARRDKSLRLDSGLLQKGKSASLKGWLQQVRGHFGERFLQLRQILTLLVVFLGAVLGWATIRGLLIFEGHHPVNVLPFLAFFVLLPLLFLLVLFFKGTASRLLGRLPGGWVSYSGLWLLSRVMKQSQLNIPALDVWQRLKSLHPRIFTLQAWILSQSFGLAYYLTAAASFLFYISVNDYVFAWQTTLRIGPEALAQMIAWISLPFVWLGPTIVPDMDLIQATQYDRFSGSYLQAQGSTRAGEWWPFLTAIIIFFGCLPRLVLLLHFQMRLKGHLRKLTFDDLASEDLWLRLQRLGLGWEAEKGTTGISGPSTPTPIVLNADKPLLVVRWRQAPFQDEELRSYFAGLGLTVSSIMDAEGRESEFRSIPESLSGGQALALVCDPWELPGEAFNRLRLALRENLSIRTPVFLVPLEHSAEGLRILPADKDRDVWEASLKAFRDPYVGLLKEGNRKP